MVERNITHNCSGGIQGAWHQAAKADKFPACLCPLLKLCDLACHLDSMQKEMLAVQQWCTYSTVLEVFRLMHLRFVSFLTA